MTNAPSGDMKAGGMHPLLQELLRQRRIQQAPMPPAQDPRYHPEQIQPSPWNPAPFPPPGGIPGINGTPMPYPSHPMPQGSGIRSQAPILNARELYSDTPGGIYPLPDKSVNATWMDVMRNRAGGTSKENGYDPWMLEYLRKRFGLKGAELEQLFMRNDEVYRPFGVQPRNM